MAKTKTTKKTATKKAPAKKTTAKKKPSPEVKVDRRASAERRSTNDRRQKTEEVADDRRAKPDRRNKVSRRRQIDPTTCERDYNGEEIEFMQALDAYKRAAGRMFPTCSEILEVLRDLGYRRLTPEESAKLSPPEETIAEGSTEATGDSVEEFLEETLDSFEG